MLKHTLLALGALPAHDAEVIVVDNASSERQILPPSLDNGVSLRSIALRENIGAAARNVAAKEASGDWLVMLDDDSHPTDLRLLDTLAEAPPGVAAVSADIFLPRHAPKEDPLQSHHDVSHNTSTPRLPRESGGLPEVFIGCGVAIRRPLFLDLGGYDSTFNYYVEEYDLSARMLLSGYRVRFDQRFVVHHQKDASQRNMDLILARLVRNNGWVAQRYAPEDRRWAEIRETRRRYRQIASREEAIVGFSRGLVELRRTLRSQPRTPMSPALFDRFTGLASARAALQFAHKQEPFRSAMIVDAGKNAWVVEQALRELGVRLTEPGSEPEVCVIGTMSPGPMLDAYAKRLALRRNRGPRLLAPWSVAMATREPVAPVCVAA